MLKKRKDLFSPETEKFVLFNDEKIRRERNHDERYFSVVDVVAILVNSQSIDKGAYRRKLKQRLKAEGSEVVTNCHGLKFIADDGKMRVTDSGNTETILRIIQSIPSPNAEPLKRWIASLGNERIQEINDPELGILRARDRAIQVYKTRGMSDDEIKQRLQSIETRNGFTDELKFRGIENQFEYALITNKTYKVFGENISASSIRNTKGLIKGDNIRDHMNKSELLMTEDAAKQIIIGNNAEGFNEIETCVEKSVEIMSETREKIEKATGTPILSKFNRLSDRQKERRGTTKKQLTRQEEIITRKTKNL